MKLTHRHLHAHRQKCIMCEKTLPVRFKLFNGKPICDKCYSAEMQYIEDDAYGVWLDKTDRVALNRMNRIKKGIDHD